jgi:peptide/nickel transport system substrate-binding protein
MYRKLLLALGLTALGASLMVAAAVAGTSSSSSSSSGSKSQVTKGGTLRINVSNTDYEYLDPALSYDAIGWATIYAVNAQLLNYPDKPASAGGNQLAPDAAAGFPVVSKDGKTYTFTVKSGLKFSDGSNLTAAAFARSIFRVCDPDQGSPAVAFANNIAGCQAFADKKASGLSGVTAKGQKLTVKLINADPTFLSQISMPFFAAVKPNMAIDPKGISVYPSAGPYKIVSRDPGRSLVLERNTFYKGTRPANADRIVITTNTDQNQSLLQVKSGEANYDLGGVPAVQNGPLSDEFGVNKSRYFVNPLTGTGYIAMNTARAPFSNVKARQAANWAVDRPALLRTRGKFGGKRTDQILAPQLPGYKDADIYSIKGANPTKAKQIYSGGGDVSLLHTTSAASTNFAQIAKFNLEQAGFKVTLKPQPFGVAIKSMGTKGTDLNMFSIGWIADYFDPFDFINVLMDGTTIADANNSNYSYFNDPKYNAAMKSAAKLAGQARYKAYGALDIDISKNAAPWISVFNFTSRDFISAKTENYIYQPVYGAPILNALAIKK